MDLRNEQTILLFKEIYKPDDSYFTVVMSIVICFITGIITIYYIIQIDINASSIEWDKNKSGFVPDPSYVNYEIIKEKYPKLLIDYIESKIDITDL